MENLRTQIQETIKSPMPEELIITLQDYLRLLDMLQSVKNKSEATFKSHFVIDPLSGSFTLCLDWTIPISFKRTNSTYLVCLHQEIKDFLESRKIFIDPDRPLASSTWQQATKTEMAIKLRTPHLLSYTFKYYWL